MPRHIIPFSLLLLALAGSASAQEKEAPAPRLAELDAYWAEVSRTVREGDFAGYKSTCHPEGVLVTGSKKTSYPLSKALEIWKKEFDDTKAGTTKSNVVFRFQQRLGDDTTAHETGMFLYSSVDAEGVERKEYIHFEALLVKRDGWKILMEYQKSKGTREQWEILK